MPPTDSFSFLSLGSLSDVELVQIAHDSSHRGPAMHTLLLRFYKDVNRQVAYLAHRCGLPRDQAEDAQQEAVWSVLEAIDGYDPSGHATAKPASFRTFLRHVVRARFFDFVRKQRRVERRIDRSVGVSGEEGCVDGRNAGRCGPSLVDADAQEREFRELLDRALTALDSRSRWLWEQWVAGVSLRALEQQTGVSYDTLRYQYRKVRAFLAARLAAWDERTPAP